MSESPPVKRAPLYLRKADAETVLVTIELPRELYETLEANCAELAPELSRNEGFPIGADDALHLALCGVREFVFQMCDGTPDDLEDFLRGPYRVVNLSRPLDRAIAELGALGGETEGGGMKPETMVKPELTMKPNSKPTPEEFAKRLEPHVSAMMDACREIGCGIAIGIDVGPLTGELTYMSCLEVSGYLCPSMAAVIFALDPETDPRRLLLALEAFTGESADTTAFGDENAEIIAPPLNISSLCAKIGSA